MMKAIDLTGDGVSICVDPCVIRVPWHGLHGSIFSRGQKSERFAAVNGLCTPPPSEIIPGWRGLSVDDSTVGFLFRVAAHCSTSARAIASSVVMEPDLSSPAWLAWPGHTTATSESELGMRALRPLFLMCRTPRK